MIIFHIKSRLFQIYETLWDPGSCQWSFRGGCETPSPMSERLFAVWQLKSVDDEVRGSRTVLIIHNAGSGSSFIWGCNCPKFGYPKGITAPSFYTEKNFPVLCWSWELKISHTRIHFQRFSCTEKGVISDGGFKSEMEHWKRWERWNFSVPNTCLSFCDVWRVTPVLHGFTWVFRRHLIHFVGHLRWNKHCTGKAILLCIVLWKKMGAEGHVVSCCGMF